MYVVFVPTPLVLQKSEGKTHRLGPDTLRQYCKPEIEVKNPFLITMTNDNSGFGVN